MCVCVFASVCVRLFLASAGIVNMFAARRHLLEHRGSYVLRRLCQLLDPQTLYIALAEILLPLEDLEFISLTIEILNILLLTASELVRGPLFVCAFV